MDPETKTETEVATDLQQEQKSEQEQKPQEQPKVIQPDVIKSSPVVEKVVPDYLKEFNENGKYYY